MHNSEDDLAPTTTDGYKAPVARPLEELKNLDANDESLRRWKESLLKNAQSGDASDPRKVVILSLAMESAGRNDVVLDLSSAQAIEKSKSINVIIKEGVEYRIKVNFKIQHEVVAGLKYIQVVKRKGIRVDKIEEMLGSYGPAATAYEKKFAPETAPSGMLARGHYNVHSRFVDDDGTAHLDFDWSIHIKKEWDAAGDE